MKKLLTVSLLLCLTAATAFAAKYATVATATANIRACGGTNCKILWRAWKYTPLKMGAVSKDKQWVHVTDFEGHEGWISAGLLSTAIGVSTKMDVNVRQTPSASAPIVCTVEKGYTFRFISKKGGWYEVEDNPEVPAEGKCRGWVFAENVWAPRAATAK